ECSTEEELVIALQEEYEMRIIASILSSRQVRGWFLSLSREAQIDMLAMSLDQILAAYKATQSDSQPMEVDSHHESQPVFEVKGSTWTEADLKPNGILSNLCGDDVRDPNGAMAAYLDMLDKKRTLRTTRSFLFDIWNELKSKIQNADSKYNIRVESTAGDDQTSTAWYELLALVVGTDAAFEVVKFWRDNGNPENPLSEFARDAVIVSKVLDSVFDRTPGYNRTVAHLYPIALKIAGRRCHYGPRPDVSIRSSNGFYWRFLVEGKRFKDNGANGSDRVKLAFMSKLNLLAASVGQSENLRKTLVIPSLYWDQSAFELFFTAWASYPETVEFKYVRRYRPDDLNDLFLLMVNLFNLRDHTFEVIKGPATVRYIKELQKTEGFSYTSREKSQSNNNEKKKSGDGSNGYDKGNAGSKGLAGGCNGGGGNKDSLGHDQPSEEELDALVRDAQMRGYKLTRLPRCFKPVYPNLHTGEDIASGTRIVVKAINSKTPELQFLRLLNSEPLKSDPRNCSIKMLDKFQSSGATYVVLPFVETLGYGGGVNKGISLGNHIWRKMEQQLKDYVTFLHEHDIVHRDIKPSNLGYLRSSETEEGSEYGQLVVFDFDLMEYWEKGKKDFEFVGTKGWVLKEYEDNPRKGFDPFLLDWVAVKMVGEWMRKVSRSDSGWEPGMEDTV
ncbi:hypothetical protein HDU76_006973, partial [Blyttiomyces sp. JEL0837]